ncbi:MULTISPECIES: signal peptidase I [unclassified Duganella]|uniref:signal peptidase I n=1 Tax=unclassified Duganella TaxID=2636909 RepID=UPI00088E3A91|nr:MULTISPECIES: signal peptidase I [unclassified Duganella]SDG67860.1 signal peptidase I [Duganella sp. OV458]SDJ93101.1 signal peptidase I Serine peptidase. MEROPS family S26A [Duganella sp. OV510]
MKNWLRANKGFVLFLALFGIFRTAVADWNPIPSASMHPNLLEGDVVFVNRLAYNVKVPLTDIVISPTGEPQRGDIVTFSSPANGTRLIKRIIALPGDRVEMRNEELSINGHPAGYTSLSRGIETIHGVGDLAAVRVDETLGDTRHAVQFLPQLQARRNFAPLVVPPGQYMMLGDNRDNSEDSRYIGLVPRALLIGRAERVLASADITGNWMPRTERFGMSLQRKE